MFMLLDLEAVILDDRIAEQFVADFVDLPVPRSLVGVRQFDFEVLADMNGPNAVATEVFEGRS